MFFLHFIPFSPVISRLPNSRLQPRLRPLLANRPPAGRGCTKRLWSEGRPVMTGLLHTAHCKLHTEQQSAHYLIYTVNYITHNAHCKLYNVHEHNLLNADYCSIHAL